MRFVDAFELEVKARYRGVRMSSRQRRNAAMGFGEAPAGIPGPDTAQRRKGANQGTTRARLMKAGIAGPTKAGLKREGAFARKRGKRMAKLDAPLERALARRVGTPVGALRTMRRDGNYASFRDFEAEIMRRADRKYRLK